MSCSLSPIPSSHSLVETAILAASVPSVAHTMFSLPSESWLLALLGGLFLSSVALFWQQLQNNLVTRLIAWGGNFFQTVGYKQRYRRSLLRAYRDFDVKGVPTQLEHGLELVSIFVEPLLVNKPVQRTSTDPTKPPDATQEGPKEIWDYLTTTKEHLVILGAPGSGKTTLLLHVVVVLAEGKHRSADMVLYQLPFVLFLRDYQEDIKHIPTFSLVQAIEKDLSKWGQAPPPGWIERQLKQRGSLVLLDGLDEVADKATRQRVVEWIDRQMTACVSSRFVLTSRPYGYHGNELSNPRILEIQSFKHEQIVRFIQNWYLAREQGKERRLDEHGRRNAQEGAEDLLLRLSRKRALRMLAVNPLLLTMIALVHRSGRTLPEKRVELYKEACEVFLGRREEARGLTLKLDPSQQQWVLEHLAYQLMQQRTVTMAQEQAEELVAKPLMEVQFARPPKEFLRLVHERSSLFLETELGLWGFAHKAFQEYLAAAYIEKRKLVQELVARVSDDWWRETILLYCARNDATPLIKACLLGNPPAIPALILALECWYEAHHLEPEVSAQLNELCKCQGDSEPSATVKLSHLLPFNPSGRWVMFL